MTISKESRGIAINHLEVLRETLGMVKSGRRNKMGQIESYLQNSTRDQYFQNLSFLELSEFQRVYENLFNMGDSYGKGDKERDSAILIRIIDNIEVEAGLKSRVEMIRRERGASREFF